MSEIKRYDLEDASRGHNAWQEMFERPDGDWMKYADHLSELSRLRSIIHDYEISEPIATNYGLQQELSRLREELNDQRIRDLYITNTTAGWAKGQLQILEDINQVICGDCLEVMKDIPDKSIDMILCDLPYGTTDCKWDTIIPFEPLWEQYKRIIKDNGAIVLTASQPFTSALVMSNVKMFKYCWYWRKNNASGFANAKKRPLKVIEDILIFSNGTPRYIPQGVIKLDKARIRTAKVGDTVGDNGFYDGYEQTETNYPKNCIEFNLDKEKLHPTQKPVALFEYLIKTYTNEGDLVLDNCAGSGTTGVACKNTNRNYILIEKEQEYIDIINKRLY